MRGLEITNLAAGYGGRKVIAGVSFTAERGALTGVLGANGCGKTTLLKSICGVLPHSGACTLDGRELGGLSVRRLATLCSYIPQRSGVAIDISALDVVLMGFNARLGLLEHPSRAMQQRAVEMLHAVGLGEQVHANYLHLSEGQKQMCILARTLVTEAPLLLMDEPESALDFRHRHRMLELLRRRIREADCVGLVSLHDPLLALNCCDQLVLLQGGVCSAVVHPAQDPLPQMAQALARIYGAVSLVRCQDGQGCGHLVMLKEREEA